MSTTLSHFHGIDDDTDSAVTAAYLHPSVLFMNYLQDDVGSIYDSETDSNLQKALELSRHSFMGERRRVPRSSSRPADSSSARPSTSGVRSSSATSYDRLQDLEAQITGCELDITDLTETIRKATEARDRVEHDMDSLIRERDALRQASRMESDNAGSSTAGPNLVDYTKDFEWTAAMRAKMKSVFGISNFRLCQAGVCNANIAGRDIICVMPTGGGKSLTYQLPAIMAEGCTFVVSPLISLMTDQILHLREFGIDAVMFSGPTTSQEKHKIKTRLKQMANDRARAGADEIKLCYVTPEGLVKNQSLQGIIQDLYNAHKLARIVIDEAHCISQQGHDFRPDYKALSMCKTFWPKVPILALSATCPPAVLKDVLHVLKLSPVVSGQNAPKTGTVYFSSPLYRKNLHYKVWPKPDRGDEVLRAITNYILNEHAGHSGIIYCFSKQDTAQVAEGIRKESDGKVRTGVYHADVSEAEKFKLHERWRKGDVQVVCATIAFGMGIDKADVRFVIHHSLSKSLDGFYQESGRAGRDGKDADCILYYRPQDALRISAATVTEGSGQLRLHEMLRFAQELRQCRKVSFAKYFNMSSKLDTASWATAEVGAMDSCGHCDNCTRDPATVENRDVTVDAWKILTISEAVKEKRGRITMALLVDLARGNNPKGEFGVVARGNRGTGKASIPKEDRECLIGEAVQLSKEDTTFLCMHLLLEGYLEEHYTRNAHTTNVYCQPARLPPTKLTLCSFEDVQGGGGRRVRCSFAVRPPKVVKKRKKPIQTSSDGGPAGTPRRASKKRKASQHITSDDEEEQSDIVLDSQPEDDPVEARYAGESSAGEDDEGWSRTLRRSPRKQAKTKANTSARAKARVEIIELSSD